MPTEAKKVLQPRSPAVATFCSAFLAGFSATFFSVFGFLTSATFSSVVIDEFSIWATSAVSSIGSAARRFGLGLGHDGRLGDGAAGDLCPRLGAANRLVAGPAIDAGGATTTAATGLVHLREVGGGLDANVKAGFGAGRDRGHGEQGGGDHGE